MTGRSSGAVTACAKCYLLAGHRAAVMTDAGETHIHDDHLGSAVQTPGVATEAHRYYPYGA